MIRKLYLLGRIGENRIAIRSIAVDSVVSVREVTPVPAAPPHVLGLFALRSRVMTLIDSGVAAGAKPVGLPEGRKTIVFDIDGHAYGIVVDQIDDAVFMEEPEFMAQAGLNDGWESVTDCMIAHEDKTYLVLDLRRIIAGPRL